MEFGDGIDEFWHRVDLDIRKQSGKLGQSQFDLGGESSHTQLRIGWGVLDRRRGEGFCTQVRHLR